MKKSMYVYKYIIALVIAVALVIAIIFGIKKTKSVSYASQEKRMSPVEIEVPITKQDTSKQPNIENVIMQNEKSIITEKIERQETDVEFSTQYRQNESLAKGKIQTIQ